MKKTARTRKGLLGGGNWIIDQVKIIDAYPAPETLANIASESLGTGGAPYNVLLDLAKMGAPFPLAAAGLVGRDPLGDRILKDCRAHRIDVRSLSATDEAPTSYTDVMTERKGGRRTFFHNRGANALWTGSDLDFEGSGARIFHLGYLLLMDALDAPDRRFGTKAAALLARAQEAGIKTCVDVVSENSTRFKKIVTPALQHADYCILNELEAGWTTGRAVRRKDGSLDPKALARAGADLLKAGVREVVVIHFPEGGYARTREGEETWQASLRVPASAIRGTAGAGDAFCAGTLFGLHEGWPMKESLLLAVCAAAASLADPTCTGGMKPLDEVRALARKYRPRKSPAS